MATRRTHLSTTCPITVVATKARQKAKKPSMYKVLMLNDDYTPMEFVVHALQRFFNKTHEEAVRIMLHVHHKGVGFAAYSPTKWRRPRSIR